MTTLIPSDRVGGRPTERVRIVRVGAAAAPPEPRPDHVAVEEPLEIRLGGQSVAVTMRTPGRDIELAVGFLIGEGVVGPEGVASAAECRAESGDGGVVDVVLRPGVEPSSGWQRNFYATSSCGVCGKASIDAVRVAAGPVGEGPRVDPAVLHDLPDRLRDAQRVFDRTGGLHAAGLFDPDGTLVVLREDVGRHNAVDKVVGRAALDGHLPLRESVLLVSGRASFEIVQKAVVAGIAFVAAVSAPSSLAVRLARECNATLVGFLRPGGFNVYAGPERLGIG